MQLIGVIKSDYTHLSLASTNALSDLAQGAPE